ncbi:MAG: cell envelope integrity protein TolA [Ideonella sp.]|nr:cell envelope integrity protein TolA [Ideonella sp.]MCC7457413.1 cell envelope integrity protein TolA [Nitrospira sp.]
MALDSTLKRHDSLMPQPLGGLRKGTALALVVHVGLIIALAFGVAWRSQTPAGVSAELWAAVPQAAAPAPVEAPKPVPTPKPPPPPVQAEQPPPKPQVNDAQIAIEKEKAERKLREQHERQERERQERARKEQERREQERERLEQEKAEQIAAQKRREAEARRQKEEEARQAKLRQENLKRMMGQAGTGGQSAGGTAPRDAGPSASYAGRIIARVKPNIVLTDDIPGNPVAVVEVRCAPDGMIIGRRLVQGSGNKTWDDAVLRAIDRTEQLPRDIDGRVPSSIVIEFRPRD